MLNKEKKIGFLAAILLSMLVLNISAVLVKAQLEGTGLPSDLQGDVEKIQN